MTKKEELILMFGRAVEKNKGEGYQILTPNTEIDFDGWSIEEEYNAEDNETVTIISLVYKDIVIGRVFVKEEDKISIASHGTIYINV